MKDLTFTARPSSENLVPIEVRVTGVEGHDDRPILELYKEGERIDFDIPYRVWLGTARGDSSTPVLGLSKDAAAQVYPELDSRDEPAYVKLDRDWKGEFEDYKQRHYEAEHREARAKVEADPGMEVEITSSYGHSTYYHARGVEDEQVREYLNDLLLPDASEKRSGVGHTFDLQPDRGRRGSSGSTTAGEILRRADEKKKTERKEREAERKRMKEIHEAAGEREILRFHCELAPHSDDLSGEILSRPAPQGGAFLMHRASRKASGAS
jgi:hypothetical protein